MQEWLRATALADGEGLHTKFNSWLGSFISKDEPCGTSGLPAADFIFTSFFSSMNKEHFFLLFYCICWPVTPNLCLRFVIWRCFYDYVPLLWYHVAWTWIEVWERSWKDQTFIQLIFFTHLVSIIRASLIGGASHSSVVKNPPASADDAGSIPGWGRSPREGSGNPAQYSCLGNAMDRGAWLTQSMGLEKGWMRVNKQQQSGIESQIQSLEHSRPREHCPTVESSLPVLSSMEVTSSLWLLGLWSVASVRNWSVHYI